LQICLLFLFVLFAVLLTLLPFRKQAKRLDIMSGIDLRCNQS
jgi:hypothetical protein